MRIGEHICITQDISRIETDQIGNSGLKNKSKIISLDSDSDNDVKPRKPNPTSGPSFSRTPSIQPISPPMRPSQTSNDDDLDAEEDAEEAAFQASMRAFNKSHRPPSTARSNLPDRNAVVSAFVHSPMPGTRPFLFRIKLGMQLRTVRQLWCQRNELPERDQDACFLVYNNSKISDFNSCAGIGIKPVPTTADLLDENATTAQLAEAARLAAEGSNDPTKGGPMFEVMTEALYRERQAKLEAERQAKLAAAEGTPADVDTSEWDDEPADTGLTLTLQAQKMAGLKVRVTPETTIAELAERWVKGAKVEGSIAAGQVRLFFDGEELEADGTVGDTELEDEDSVEVRISNA